MHEYTRAQDQGTVLAGVPGRDGINWRCDWLLRKFHGDWTGEQIDAQGLKPYEEIHVPGNLLMTAGATLILTKLIGGSGQVLDNSNAYLGVGDSSTAASAAQTDLQASSNKLRKAMDATYPSVATNVLTARSTFASGDANYAWEEWGLFNASSGGTMLNRKVQSLGTKVSGASWQFTITLTLT